MAALSNCQLQGKVAIITGSNSGIGEGIAYEFIKQGASVTLTGRNIEKLETVGKKCVELSGNEDRVLLIPGDITQEDVRIKLIQETVKKFGKLDILINNAGNAWGSPLITDFEISRLDAMLDIHVRAPFHLTKLVIPHLIHTKGNIINISSIAGLRPFSPRSVEYGIAKSALDSLTKISALELGAQSVRVNAINPGVIETPFFERNVPNPEIVSTILEQLGKSHALKRIGSIEEIAKVATFLASDGASFVTGITMPVDGGALLMPPSGFIREEN